MDAERKKQVDAFIALSINEIPVPSCFDIDETFTEKATLDSGEHVVKLKESITDVVQALVDVLAEKTGKTFTNGECMMIIASFLASFSEHNRTEGLSNETILACIFKTSLRLTVSAEYYDSRGIKSENIRKS